MAHVAILGTLPAFDVDTLPAFDPDTLPAFNPDTLPVFLAGNNIVQGETPCQKSDRVSQCCTGFDTLLGFWQGIGCCTGFDVDTLPAFDA